MALAGGAWTIIFSEGLGSESGRESALILAARSEAYS
jgi:hypothetical protein